MTRNPPEASCRFACRPGTLKTGWFVFHSICCFPRMSHFLVRNSDSEIIPFSFNSYSSLRRLASLLSLTTLILSRPLFGYSCLRAQASAFFLDIANPTHNPIKEKQGTNTHIKVRSNIWPYTMTKIVSSSPITNPLRAPFLPVSIIIDDDFDRTIFWKLLSSLQYGQISPPQGICLPQ